MKKVLKNKKPNWLQIGGFFLMGLILGIVLLIALARISWHNKYYPGVEIAGVVVAGLTQDEARVKLQESINTYQVALAYNEAIWETPIGAINYEIEASLNEAYRYGRRLEISDYLLLLVNKKTQFPLVVLEGKTDKLELLISQISSSVEIPPIEPKIEIVNKQIKIANGEDGVVIDGERLNKKLNKQVKMLDKSTIEIPTKVVNKQIGDDKLNELQNRAEKLLGKELTLVLDDERIRLQANELVTFLVASDATISEYVMGLAESLNKPPQNAKFEFDNGKVSEFAPGLDGVEVQISDTRDQILVGINKLLESDNKHETVEIAVARTTPSVTTNKVNELGINERIGRGESYYAHSIPNRIYNVGLSSARLNSALIAPGEEVSFNKLVGEVSSATGYRSAYIIEKGRTVLGDGGGLCQVSTTMFRAVMSAGLPITERWAHAYRVSYYELNSKPGVDATVIAPSKDFRFKNDTPGHILIQTINDPKKLHLVIEIYGTNDGRMVTTTEPKVWGIAPPPPDIYQDDPSLATGTIKQVDWSAWGAKASFEYKVVRDGETIQEKTFSSSYRPWANVYLRGVGI